MSDQNGSKTEDYWGNSLPLADSSNGNDDSDEEAFEDASESVYTPMEMDLATSIDEASMALNLFLNNHFTEARERLKPWRDRSAYHSLGYGTLMYLQAALTFEESDIQAAVTAVKKACRVCDRSRKKWSMLSTVNYDKLTELEIHAEICYAELLIMRALLTFVQDENLISFVKGSLKIRACYLSYKECLKILQKRNWKNDTQKEHFESGVRLGIGIFNLMLSLLPTKVLKLLEFVGFSGNKQLGLSELEAGANMETSLRGPLCSLTLLGYHSVMTYVLGTADGDIELCDKLIKPCLQKYPKGAMFLFFAGRILEIQGNLDGAIEKFEESVDAQSEWRQFHHLCYWELMWCHSYRGDWLLAMKYAERLCRESRWSRATYTYQKAAFLLMCNEQSEDTESHVKYLMGEVPKLQLRIAGKSIPIEKFAVRKAKRFLEQGGRLTLPALELIYVWNGFMIIGKQPELLMPILTTVEKTINHILDNQQDYKYYHDDYCLALLLKGICLRHRGSDFQAEQCFREVWQNAKKIKLDNYLVPYALMELAQLFMHTGNLDEARNILQKCKEYKGYSLESRLHFRMHAANMQLKNMMNPDMANEISEDMSTPPDSRSLNDSPTPPPSPINPNKSVMTHL